MANNSISKKNPSASRNAIAGNGAVSNGVSKATLKTYNQTPRKVRLVTELVKGKRIDQALAALEFLPRRAAEPVAKLISSAVASAKAQGENVDELVVKNIIVENAGMSKKYMPRAFGRASLIRRRKSRVIVELSHAKAPNTKHQIPNKS